MSEWRAGSARLTVSCAPKTPDPRKRKHAAHAQRPYKNARVGEGRGFARDDGDGDGDGFIDEGPGTLLGKRKLGSAFARPLPLSPDPHAACRDLEIKRYKRELLFAKAQRIRERADIQATFLQQQRASRAAFADYEALLMESEL